MAKTKNITFDVLIEIPKGSRNKYEYDFTLNKIRFDRMLFSSMMYPGDYGFIPETLALDSDPLDVLVMGTEPTFPIGFTSITHIGKVGSVPITSTSNGSESKAKVSGIKP